MAPNPNPPTAQSTSSQETTPSFGWNDYAERINGRFAMIGILSLLLLELVTHETFFAWIGLG